VLEHRALRFVVEALILVAVAIAVTVADLSSPVIVGVMVLAWAVVSLLEWAFLQGESHFASGLPPRYYVPQLRLPAKQIEQYYALGVGPPIPLEPAAEIETQPLFDDARDQPAAVGSEPQLDPQAHADVVVEEGRTESPAKSLAEPEPVIDYKLVAAELRSVQRVESSWFDSELPGGTDDAGLLRAALAELENEWVRAAEASPQVVEQRDEPEPPANPPGRRLLPGRSRRGN